MKMVTTLTFPWYQMSPHPLFSPHLMVLEAGAAFAETVKNKPMTTFVAGSDFENFGHVKQLMMQSELSNGSTSIWCWINFLCTSSWGSPALHAPSFVLKCGNCEEAKVLCGNWSTVVFENWSDSLLAAPSPQSFAITWCLNVWGGLTYPGDLQV